MQYDKFQWMLFESDCRHSNLRFWNTNVLKNIHVYTLGQVYKIHLLHACSYINFITLCSWHSGRNIGLKTIGILISLIDIFLFTFQFSAFSKATSAERGGASAITAAHFGTSGMSEPISMLNYHSEFSFPDFFLIAGRAWGAWTWKSSPQPTGMKSSILYSM